MTYEYLQARIAPGQQNPRMGIVPAGSIILTPFIAVPTGFDSDGTDLIRVGSVANDDGYGTDKDVSGGIGLADFTAGADIGYTRVGVEVYAKYVNGGSEPTAGEAFVVLPYIRVRKS